MLGNASENSSSQRTRSESLYEDHHVSSWVVPIGNLAGTRFYLSCSALVAAAILITVVVTVSGQQGKRDLPYAALIGAGFWVVGWIVQACTILTVGRIHGHRVRQMTFNLLGPESHAHRRPAGESLLAAISSLLMLLFCGAIFWWADGGFRTPVFTLGGDLLRTPSMGLRASDSVWRSGAWLCWAQAVFQVYPLPRTTGRQIMAALTSVSSGRLETEQQVTVFRRCLMCVGFATLLAAAWLIAHDDGSSIPRWPLLMLLGVLVWISAGAADLRQRMVGFRLASPPQSEDDRLAGVMRPQSPRRLWGRLRAAWRSRRERRRVLLALENERREASDARRLDEILQRLHAEGIESLSMEERDILKRVSEALRKERELSGRPDADDGRAR